MLDEGSILGNAIKGITPFIHSSMISNLKSKLPKYVNITYTEVNGFDYRGVWKTINDVVHEDGAKLYQITGLPVNDKFNEFEIFMNKKISDLIHDRYLPNISQYIKTNTVIQQLSYNNQYISFDGYHIYIALTDEYISNNIISITYGSTMSFEIKTYDNVENNSIISLFDLEEDYIKLNQLLVDTCNFIVISNKGMDRSLELQRLINKSNINEWIFNLNSIDENESCGVIVFYYYSDSRYYTVYDKIMSLCDNSDEFTKFVADMTNDNLHLNDEEQTLINSYMDYDINNDDYYEKMIKILEFDTDKFSEFYSEERNIYTIQTTGKAIIDLDGKISLQSKKNKNTKSIILLFVNGKLLHNFYELEYSPMYVIIPNVRSYISYDDIIEIVYIFGIVSNADEDEEFDISATHNSNYIDYEFYTDTCDTIFNVSDKKKSTCQYKLPVNFVFDMNALKFKATISTSTFEGVTVDYNNIGKVIKSYKNKYRYVSYTITDTCVGVSLPDVFKYCQDTSRYVIFLNGYKVNAQDIIFTIPNPTNPFFELAVYFKYILKTGDILDIFYLPNGFYSDNFDKVNEYFALTLNLDKLSFNLDPKYGMVFVDGLKVDNSSIRKIKSNTIQITRIFPNINNAELLMDDTVILDQSTTILDRAINFIEEKSPNTVYSPIRIDAINNTIDKSFSELSLNIYENLLCVNSKVDLNYCYDEILCNLYDNRCCSIVNFYGLNVGFVEFSCGYKYKQGEYTSELLHPQIILSIRNPLYNYENNDYITHSFDIDDSNKVLYYSWGDTIETLNTVMVKSQASNISNESYYIVSYISKSNIINIYQFIITLNTNDMSINSIPEQSENQITSYELDSSIDLSNINNASPVHIADIRLSDTKVLLLFSQCNEDKITTFAIIIESSGEGYSTVQSISSMQNIPNNIEINPEYFGYLYNTIKNYDSDNNIATFILQYYFKCGTIYKPINIAVSISLDEYFNIEPTKSSVEWGVVLYNHDDLSYVGSIEQQNGDKLVSPPIQFSMLDNEVSVTLHNNRGNGIDALVYKENTNGEMDKIASYYIPTPYTITEYETEYLTNKKSIYDSNNFSHGGSINIYPRAFKINENYIMIVSPKGVLGFFKVYKNKDNIICTDYDDSIQSYFIDDTSAIYCFNAHPVTIIDNNNNICIYVDYIVKSGNHISASRLIYDLILNVCTSTGFKTIFDNQLLGDIRITINEIILYYYGTIYDGTNFVYTFDTRGIAEMCDDVALLDATTGKDNIPNIKHDYFNN